MANPTNDQDLIEAYLKTNEVTECPPASGLQTGLSTQLKDTVRESRAEWKERTGRNLT